jgi:chromosome segregation ATPase
LKNEKENHVEQNDNEEILNKLNNKILELESFIRDLTSERENLLNELNELKELQMEKEKQMSHQISDQISNQISEHNSELERLAREHEEEKNMSALLRKDRQELEHKLQSMKNTLGEIKEKFEIELAKKENMISDSNTNTSNLNELLKKIKTLEDFIKSQKKTINSIAKEKLELEEIILKQEDRVSELNNKFNLIDKMVKDKNRELKENEQNILQLVNIIEEQKRTLSNYGVQGVVEGNTNDVVFLKNHVDNLRREIESKIHFRLFCNV